MTYKLRSVLNSQRWGQWLRPLLIPIVLLAMWQAWAPLEGSASGIAPTPVGVARGFWELTVSGELPSSLFESLTRIASGFCIAFTLGISMAICVWYVRLAEYLIDPLIETFRPIAPIAWIPLAILWFGTGTWAAIFIVSYAIFFPVFVNTLAGLQSLDKRLLDAALTLGATKYMMIRDVVLPGAMPAIVLGGRLGMGAGWAAIIAAEMTVGSKSGGGASGGIGQMMFIFLSYSLELRYIIVGMITVGCVAYMIDSVFRLVQRRISPWIQTS